MVPTPPSAGTGGDAQRTAPPRVTQLTGNASSLRNSSNDIGKRNGNGRESRVGLNGVMSDITIWQHWIPLFTAGDTLLPFLKTYKGTRRVIVAIVYLSLLFDNVLLTMVVPIIPDFLISLKRLDGNRNATFMGLASETSLLDFDSENGRVGLLLSSKAIVQLLLNPIVGIVTAKIGYHLPLIFGTLILFISAITFAFGGGYITLLLARSLQGVASSCIGITGMCLVAEKYPTEPNRSKMMGFVLGSVAVGVLIGYPLGGFLYDSLGKSAPFVIVAALITVNFGIQLCFLDLTPEQEDFQGNTEWLQLFADHTILLTGGAIGISTSAMAILEPCLPLWLMKEIKPKRWQLGTAFIPDSVGYVIGTNFIGLIAYAVDRFKIAMWSMILVGISAFLIPTATTMTQLVVPHFLLGFGIGAVDAALVPLLAALVDARQSTHYVSVYAMQQMAVSLAYSFGPVIGGEMVRAIGFPWLMRVIGVINVLYSPAIVALHELFLKRTAGLGTVDYRKRDSADYQTFTDSD